MLDNVEKVAVDMEGVKGAFKQVPISKDDGAPVFSFRVFTLEANGNTPYHQHPFEHVNYVIEGNGVIVKENGEGVLRILYHLEPNYNINNVRALHEFVNGL